MPCYHPFLLGYYVDDDGTHRRDYSGSINRPTAKEQYEFDKNGTSGLLTQSYLDRRQLEVCRCNNCIGCRVDWSRDWSNRIILESLYHEKNAFITLTYDDEHLPLGREVVFTETGELMRFPTLRYKDFQDFNKRFRISLQRNFGIDNVRFYCAGEYGAKTARPHFHAIVFGWYPDDIQPFRKSKSGLIQYTSPYLKKVWGNGDVAVGSVSWSSANYVSHYILKKHKGKDAVWYDDRGIESEKTYSSRRPGLARSYYDKNHDTIYEFDKITLWNSYNDRLIISKPCKYFDYLLNIDDPDQYQDIKESRKNSIKSSPVTDIEYVRYLEVEENGVKHRLDLFKREF